MRLFIAWPLPDEVRAEIGERARDLRKRLPAASWPRSESLHLTLLFLGETAEDRLAPLESALESVADLAAVCIRVSGAGFFPSRSRPRVAWLGIAPAEPVVAIAAAVREAVGAEGAGADEGRPFHPHLTLARIRGRWKEKDAAAFEAAFSGWSSRPIAMDRIVLIRSRLSPKGAEHEPLREVRLAEPAGGG